MIQLRALSHDDIFNEFHGASLAPQVCAVSSFSPPASPPAQSRKHRTTAAQRDARTRAQDHQNRVSRQTPHRRQTSAGPRDVVRADVPTDVTLGVVGVRLTVGTAAGGGIARRVAGGV